MASDVPPLIEDTTGHIHSIGGFSFRVVNCGGWYAEIYRHGRFMRTTKGKKTSFEEAFDAAQTVMSDMRLVEMLTGLVRGDSV